MLNMFFFDIISWVDNTELFVLWFHKSRVKDFAQK